MKPVTAIAATAACAVLPVAHADTIFEYDLTAAWQQIILPNTPANPSSAGIVVGGGALASGDFLYDVSTNVLTNLSLMIYGNFSGGLPVLGITYVAGTGGALSDLTLTGDSNGLPLGECGTFCVSVSGDLPAPLGSTAASTSIGGLSYSVVGSGVDQIPCNTNAAEGGPYRYNVCAGSITPISLQSQSTVPEIQMGAAGPALTLLAGALAVLRARRRPQITE